MNHNRIGRTSLSVSDICLGTMTVGSSCDERTSFEIMDYAVEQGIDFFDTAEIYPVPPEEKWVHRTEEIVGKWLKTRKRESITIATKVAGAGGAWFTPPIRSGKTGLDRRNIKTAVEGSLRRLQTDYIDLYQTHWPDHDFGYEETLTVLDELVQEGKIRFIGSSNENAWGTMKAQATAERLGTARYESIQNNFSILNRRFEDELANICRREQTSLLPYSPLGGGVLTGKYNVDPQPENARFTQYAKGAGERQRQMAKRFLNEKSLSTTEALKPIAADLGLSLATLALIWSKQHDYVASTIVGANTVEQLQESLQDSDRTLDADTLARIDAISAQYPYPMG
ncbi:aldo/keto reductase [Pelagicoccus mobilis]|uniref:Aldo/keto reductase n=1 Tax=Pelagicoccus mobilis TaxID=415221 RepID=A0A934RWL7_9BACT|nr:aldo/keto reductase [Pelagicoccus mobilis]MBK1879100.1 aldo/keto reductase [Pelagicoccus mobilis]